MRKLAKLAVCTAFLTTYATFAADAKSESKVKSKAAKKESKAWQASANAILNSNLYKTSSVNHSASMNVDANWGYKFDNKVSIGASLVGNKALTGTREFELLSSSFSLKRPIKKFKYVSLSGGLRVKLPTSEYARKIQQLNLGVSASAPIIMALSKLGVPGLTLVNVPAVSVNDHKFKTALNGTPNTQYTLSNAFVVSYGATDWLTFKGLAQYAKSFTYNNNTKDSYYLSQSILFTIATDTFSDMGIEIGHGYGGTPLAPNGRDTEVKLFDSKSSTVFLGFGLAI